MNKNLRNLAILMGTALLSVTGVAGAESLTPGAPTYTASLNCNPGVNVEEGNYGAWVATAAGHVVCETYLVTFGQGHSGQIKGHGAASSRICGSNDNGTVGGCYAAYASYTGTGNYTLAAASTPLPADTGWTQRYAAIFLNAGSYVSVLK